MYKEDLALSNLQWLICHKPNPTKPNQTMLSIANSLDNISSYLLNDTYIFSNIHEF